MTSDPTRRRVLQLLGAGALVGTAGCSSLMGPGSGDSEPETTAQRQTTTSGGETIGETTAKQTTTAGQTATTGGNETATTTAEPLEFEAPSGVTAGVTLPSNPGSYRYATMGSSDAPVTATLYGAWFCPYTNDVVMNFMDTLVQRYVQPGEVQLRFRAIPYKDGEGYHGSDEPKVARAALAVWNEAPEQYWSFFKYLYKNADATATWSADDIVKLAEAAGIQNTGPIREAYEGNPSYEDAFTASMQRTKELGFSVVPRIVVGDTISKPSVSNQQTIQQLERALQGPNAGGTGGNTSGNTTGNESA